MRISAESEKWMDWNGCRVRYVDTGGDGPAIFFPHGLGGKIEDNSACFPFFEKDFRVVAPDFPGSGYSDKPPDLDYSIDFLVDFTFDFADRLGLDRFYLCGGSQGGLQTLLCCLHSPERVIKAAVYSPAGVWPANPAAARLVRLLPPEAVRLFFSVTSLFWNSPSYPRYWENRREAMEFINSMELPGFGRHVFGCLASMLERDNRALFAKVSVPVLILWGRHDFGMPVSQGRELVKILPDARLIEVPRAGHNVSTELPEYFASEVSTFFMEPSGGGHAAQGGWEISARAQYGEKEK